jgi:hypothetical protein
VERGYGLGVRSWRLKFRDWSSEFVVKGFEYKAYGSGFRV